MMSEETRNPSPPPLTEEERVGLHGDFIGDTIFSKRSVLHLLLKMFKHDAEFIYQSKTEKEKNSNGHKGEKEEAFVYEPTLTKQFENAVCELWDMSANTDVALFLYENECKEILMDVLEKTQSPRLMEVSLGLIGNLVCIKEICTSYCQDSSYCEQMIGYLTITDIPSLVELTRLLKTSISRESCTKHWVDLMKTNSTIDQFAYLLENSLNFDILAHIIEILDVVFDADDDIIDDFLTEKMLTTLIDVYGTLSASCATGIPEALTSLMHIFQLISTINKGIELLKGSQNEVTVFLFNCLSEFDNSYLSTEQMLARYASIFSTFLCLLNSSDAHGGILLDFCKYLTEFQRFIDVVHSCFTKITNEMTLTGEIYLTVCFDALYELHKSVLNATGRGKDEEKYVTNYNEKEKKDLTKLKSFLRDNKSCFEDILSNVKAKDNETSSELFKTKDLFLKLLES